jgi:hypothetical protein
MNRCEYACWAWIWACSQPIILLTATVLPVSWLTTSFPLFPSSCRVISSWWVRSGCSVALKFGTYIPTTDHVTKRCLCDVTAVRSDRDMKVSDVLQIDPFWWFFAGHWFSKLGLKKTRSIHCVSECIIRNALYVLNHWEEWWKWVVFAECVLTTIMNNLFYCMVPDVWDICTLSRKITLKIRHPRVYDFTELDMSRFRGNYQGRILHICLRLCPC